MIQVINGEIKQYSLPKLDTLSTGESVSDYHILLLWSISTKTNKLRSNDLEV